jgi:hypothetical protein
MSPTTLMRLLIMISIGCFAVAFALTYGVI